MLPNEDKDKDDDGKRKPARPYLKKGDGTARFRMGSSSGRLRTAMGASEASENPQTRSPVLSLPRFTPLNHPPTSSRTADSGISNEDETRPPTTSSLPMDNPSTSPPHTAYQSYTPSVMEDHDGKRHNVDSDVDNVEQVSAMPTFVPEEEHSTQTEPDSEISEEALKFRAESKHMQSLARKANSIKSVSFTPSTYSSNLSDPVDHSTPKTNEDITFEPPPLLPPSFDNIPSFSSSSLETPQARPFANNRMNIMVQNEAQTGISLLNNQQRRRIAPSRQVISTSSDDQKENIEGRSASNASEHVYDQPLNLPQRQRQRTETQQQKLKQINRNMTLQLRDTIAHLDYATEGVWSTKQKLEEERKNLKDMRKKLEEEFREKFETIQEENKAETESLKRERRDIERDRKALQAGTGKREKELTETISSLREKLVTSETQCSKLRQDVRSLNDKLKKKDEEIEKLNKDYTRSKNVVQTLEKRNKTLRNEKEKEDKERMMIEGRAMNRTMNYPPHHLNQSLGTGTATTSATTSKNPSVSSMAGSKKTPASKGRTVSFADEPNEQSLEAVEQTMYPELMRPYESGSDRFGSYTMYRDSFGEITKLTPLRSNGYLINYSNGDFRWANLQRSVGIYQYAADKTMVVELVHSNIEIICSLQRQLEVVRPGNNITLISVKRKDVRTELHGLTYGTFYTEIFDRNGRYVAKDFCHREVNQDITLGATYSQRENDNRYVKYYTAFDDFELVEPEFRLRWYKGEQMVCKIIPQCNQKILRLELNPLTGNGKLETVESQQKDGVFHKALVFQWP